LEDRRLLDPALAEGAVPEAGDLAELELHVVDGGLDAGTPFIEHLSRVLQTVKPGALRVLEVEEPAVPLLVVLGEALAELVGEPLLRMILTAGSMAPWRR